MVEIGDKPIIEHLVEIYSRQGFTDFNLALGYKKELLEEWASKIVKSKPINIVCTDTGEDTQTGLWVNLKISKYLSHTVMVWQI
jgi:glucose-1-phosphate cytidylyltransferase